MKIHYSIVVRKAEVYAGGYSVEYGPSTFTYCGSNVADSYDSLRAELDRVAHLLATDSRLAAWPGLYVSAELPRGTRKPNGWDKNRDSTAVSFKISHAMAEGGEAKQSPPFTYETQGNGLFVTIADRRGTTDDPPTVFLQGDDAARFLADVENADTEALANVCAEYFA